MALKLITAPTEPAVPLEDAKAHLRVEGADDDALITSMIHAATEAAEQMTGRARLPAHGQCHRLPAGTTLGDWNAWQAPRADVHRCHAIQDLPGRPELLAR